MVRGDYAGRRRISTKEFGADDRPSSVSAIDVFSFDMTVAAAGCLDCR